MTSELMTQKQATMILNHTNAVAAIECLHYDAAEHYGPVTWGFIKRTVGLDLEPIADLLKPSEFGHNQFKDAACNLDFHGLIERRGVRGGHVATATLCEADKYFDNRVNFGARTVAEFRTAVEVMLNSRVNGSYDPVADVVTKTSKETKLDQLFDRLADLMA